MAVEWKKIAYANDAILKSLLTTQGDMIYATGASTPARLAKGTALQYMRMNSGATAPEWANAREVLTADTTFYVRSDGHDTASGLNNTTDATTGAWLTPQHAIDVLTGTQYDFGGKNHKIKIGSGTYGVCEMMAGWIGGGTLTIEGDTSTPSNVVFDSSDWTPPLYIGATLPGTMYIDGIKTVDGNYGIHFWGIGTIQLGKIVYGASNYGHLCAGNVGSCLYVASNYEITGGSESHYTLYMGNIWVDPVTVTLTGTPDFSVGFAYGSMTGSIYASGVTFSGSATGPRYLANTNAVVHTNGGGASYFPGDSAGSVSTGGQYL